MDSRSDEGGGRLIVGGPIAMGCAGSSDTTGFSAQK